jgi:transcriptional regulator with XRE-family HTH domain
MLLPDMAATTTSERGGNLRTAREQAGLTRVQLANLIGCSLAQLANIEQGAVPKRSHVLRAALEAIGKHVKDDDPVITPGRVEESGGTPRHAEE